ncbi:MAG: hypothetical protein DKM50_03840 [Candidatus Margulisiibacteriota bacterium]|nr:MAG: hypothetical protein A2X43_01555 [Candidatus Margulisbacteria bacterium GWD2_39_127]PZM82268.1 MAG: hypothetical protein DKM50_03840 [Candidatus Margulisiibacteriota bacterium]HAR62986.1 hypothetical protein [Candidatus Margulisiibacteriota bacterium]HCY36977.1 hypothetical protein [Candidatus Margulisiibacteriota bacterium]
MANNSINVINIKVSQNEMQAVVRISSAKDDFCSEDIIKELKKNFVIFGIDNELIDKIVTAKLFEEDHIVAVGVTPIPGEDTKKEFFFEIKNKEPKPIIREDGSVDHYNLDTVLQVEEGELLSKIISSTKGIPGMTVTGKELKTSNGRELPLKAGNNVVATVVEDGMEFHAKITGCPKLIGNTVHVSSQYIIETDIDFSVGNVEFNGDIVIKGDVLDGFKVIASGNIDVHGNIKNAIIEAGGTVNALGGIIAKDKGYVKAGVDVNAIFIESGNVEAVNKVNVKRAIMHSKIKAGNSIVCAEGKGLVVGGELIADNVIQAKDVGSEYSTKTKITVGNLIELKERMQLVSSEIERVMENFTKLKLNREKLEESISAGKAASPVDQAKIDQLKAFHAKINDAQRGLLEQLKKLKEEQTQVSEQIEQKRTPMLAVSGKVYPGVDITMNGCKCHMEKTLSYVTFYEKGGQIKMSKFVAAGIE